MMKHIELERNWEYIYEDFDGIKVVSEKIFSEKELVEYNLKFVCSRQIHDGK